MRDDTEKRLDILFAAVRSEPVDTEKAERFFETRLMARIRERQQARVLWYEQAWRCIPAFGLITILLVVCNFTIGWTDSVDPFASIGSGHEESVSRSIMSGE